MINKMTDERLQELYELEKAKASPDLHILYAIAGEKRYRNRDAIAAESELRKKQVVADIGATMQNNIRKAAETKALFVPVEKP